MSSPLLAGWTVLDLTDHRGDVGPYMLAELGADVLKVEPVGGCPTRHGGPSAHHFAAYNSNKRLVALSGERARDRATVLALAAGADVVFDSGPPGRLAALGIGEGDLAAANPTVVRVLVTPFGADGPRADQPASELTVAALGGPMRLQGTPERAPVHFSVPQAWRHTGAEAAVAAMVAHRRMLGTGEPQWVDVSAQAAMTWTMLNTMEAHAIQGSDVERNGSRLSLAITVQLRLDAADGWAVGVPTARLAGPLVGWLIEDGIVDASWAAIDWATYDHRAISGQPTEVPMEAVTEAVLELCRRHTRQELFERGLAFGATVAPLNDVADLLAFGHLDARSFWVPVDGGGEAPAPVRFPGAFTRIDGERPAVTRRWPGPDAPAAPPALETARPARAGRGSGVPGQGAAAGELPLAGIKVVDFSWIGVGPITAKALADHGATVIRVESERRVDGLRLQPPYKDGVPGLNRSNFFGAFNTSKLGLALDLKNPAGLGVARQLVDWADVVLESFTPGTFAGLGLGYEQVSAGHQDLIMVSTSLLGPGSPVSGTAGYGYHAAAIAGFQGLVGWPDLPPDGPYLAYTDTIAPRLLATAVLAALERRRRTGEGCLIEAAQLEIALQLLAPELLAYQVTGDLPPRRGNRAPDLAPQGAYPTRGHDQWLALTVPDDRAWACLVDLLGRPSWAADPALATVAGRQAAHDEIDAHLTRWTADQDGPDLERRLAAAGIPAGVVQASSQLATDPQYLHRRFYRHLEHAEAGVIPYAGHQYRIAGYDHGPRSAAPCLGQHTWEVLTEILGLGPDEVADLAAAGVLE